ncbi:cutinase family protein [Streptomyces virginiae]|uniref:cutinase family protein n=1 Tax=Streptomyces virginiae TaxID=1961 RepID=UPI0036E2ADDA
METFTKTSQEGLAEGAGELAKQSKELGVKLEQRAKDSRLPKEVQKQLQGIIKELENPKILEGLKELGKEVKHLNKDPKVPKEVKKNLHWLIIELNRPKGLDGLKELHKEIDRLAKDPHIRKQLKQQMQQLKKQSSGEIKRIERRPERDAKQVKELVHLNRAVQHLTTKLADLAKDPVPPKELKAKILQLAREPNVPKDIREKLVEVADAPPKERQGKLKKIEEAGLLPALWKLGAGKEGEDTYQPDCSKETFMFAVRGSGENEEETNYLGGTKDHPSAISKLFDSLNTPPATAGVYGIPYAASEAGHFFIETQGFQVGAELPDNTRRGASVLASMIKKQIKECKGENLDRKKIILSGYSQGAVVVRAAVASLPVDLQKHIHGITLFGDPGPQQAGPDLPSDLKGRTYNKCLHGDPVCDENLRSLHPGSVAARIGGLELCAAVLVAKIGMESCPHFSYQGEVPNATTFLNELPALHIDETGPPG